MKTETIVHAHIVTSKDYLDLVERVESDTWTDEHVKTSWELFGQVDGKNLGSYYMGMTKEDAVKAFKVHKDYILSKFHAELDKL